uniref:Uncharacterized protein n=1 Tax=Arundo donax TaxID=35708 RepID=A0A0A9EKY7_ARUDO
MLLIVHSKAHLGHWLHLLLVWSQKRSMATTQRQLI